MVGDVDPSTRGLQVEIGGYKIRCHNYTNGAEGWLTIGESIERSCNVTLIRMAEVIGIDEFLKYMSEYNFGLKTNIDLAGEARTASLVFNSLEDKVVKILGAVWNCVDVGFGHNKPVDAVIRPEDIDLVAPGEGVINGVVTNLIFKGVHYEMEVLANNYELPKRLPVPNRFPPPSW